ncbi:MAG: transporter substrate-binding domain-containing protein [Desulfobulbaceae bacterium]|nr:transporter substrate-binding domain-containing protein [Desulfobulbaceae bacterium]
MKNNIKYLFGYLNCIIFVVLLMASSVAAAQTLKFGLHQNKPLNFRDQDGQPKGLVIDLFTHIATQEDWQIEYVSCDWKNCLEKLENGTIDVLSAIGYTSNRQKIYDFTETPLITNWGLAVTKPDAEIQSILDLEGKRIAVMRRAGHTVAFQNLLKKFRINVKYLKVDDFMQVFQLVHEGKVDAGIVNRLIASQFAKKYKIQKSAIIFNPIEIRYAFTKNQHEQTIKTIDKYLLQMRQSEESVYHKSLNNWFGEGDSITLPDWLKWLLFSSFILIVLFIVISYTLRHQVKIKTEALHNKNKALEKESKERRLTEIHLRESEAKFRAMSETSPLAIYMSEGIEQKAEYINPTFIKFFGYTIEDVPTVEQWWPLAYPDKNYRKQIAEEWQKKIADAIALKSEIEPVESVVTCKDGSNKIISWGFVNFGDQSWAFGLNLTEQKKAEEEKVKLESQLRQAQKMEAIGTMAGGISHNFNNILGSVLGYADMVKDEIPKDSISYKDIQKVLSSARRAEELVKQIMTFSQQNVGSRENLQSDILLHESLRYIKESIPKSIQVDENIPLDVGEIEVDPHQFKTVVANLCMNALDAMQDGEGVLGIILEKIELKDDDMLGELGVEPGDFIKLTISDTGQGIPTNIIGRVFDPFFTTREVGQGDGIGLSVVHGIIQKCGGMIKVESEVGKGSEFHVFLPVAETVSE